MPQTLKVGVIGYGYATATFHAPLIASVPGLALTAISSSNPHKVFCAWPSVEIPATPDALIARPDIDLIVIPTPNDTHFPLAAKALAAGKHVVVDKPFTLTSAEACELIAKARAAGRLLSVFHNRRWDADFLTLRQIIESGQLGRLVHFESHFDRYRPEVRTRWRESAAPGSGLWYDLGAHLIDQSLQLFGTPETISLDLAQQRDGALTDDWFHAVLRYGSLRVILHGSVLAPDVGPRYVLHGTTGTFTKYGLDPQEDAMKVGRQPGDAGWGVDTLPGTLTTWRDGHGEERDVEGVPGDYRHFYAGVRAAILHGSANPVPAEDALRVTRVIELGQQAFAEGRVVAVGGSGFLPRIDMRLPNENTKGVAR